MGSSPRSRRSTQWSLYRRTASRRWHTCTVSSSKRVRADCRVENLHWGTHAENIRDVIRHGNGHGGPPKTHCPQGHSYNDRDVNKAGHHFCRICLRAGAVVRNVQVSDNDGRCRSRYLAPSRTKHIRCVEHLGHAGDHQAPYYNETWSVDSPYIIAERALPQREIDLIAEAVTR
jgi:hypothetical protein